MKDDARERGERRSSLRRRTFLKATGGAAGTAFVAGCTGGDGNGDGGDDDSDGGDGDSDGGDGNSETDFPTQQIDLIIPYSPGGGYDTYSRLVTPYLEEHLPNDVNVQPRNVEGASGRIATEDVYASEPDGYTIQILNLDNFSKQQVLEDVGFDLTKVTYFAQIAANVRSILVADHAGIGSWDDFVEATRNNELAFGSTGPQSGGAMVPAVTGELSGAYSAENVLDNLVIYDGTGEIQQGMLSGDVDVLGISYSSGLPYTQNEGISMFLVTSAQDEPPEQTPDAETLTSVGIEQDTATRIQSTLTANRAFGGPPGIPEDRAEILEQAFADAIQDPDFIADAEEAERPVQYGDAEFAAQAAADKIETWTELRDLIEPE